MNGSLKPSLTQNPDKRNEAEHQLNDTLTVAAHPNGEILFTSFNANAIYRLNPETDDWVSEPVSLGESSEIQGPIDMAIGEGSQAKVYVAKSIANAISVWSPGGSVVSPDPFVSGPVTNRIIWNDNILYVVNSGANHVAEIEISSGSTKIVSAFPVGSNPWEVAIADGIGYVTLFQRNEVIAFDLNNGDWLWRSQAP